MRGVSIGTQAGVFDSRLLVGFLVDLIEKCHAIQMDFTLCMNNIREGRLQINQTEEAMNTMHQSFGRFGETLEELSSQALQRRATNAQRNAQVERLRRDIALREDRLSKLMEQTHHIRHGNEGRRVQDIRDERNRTELQLARVTRDIDQTYEDAFEVEDKLERLREFHQQKNEAAQAGLNSIQNTCTDMDVKRRRILSLNNGDNTVDLSELYTNPAGFRQLQIENEDLKHRLVQVERHIQMQLGEREFLRQAAAAIMQKVYDLEMKVRKETGDHGFYSLSTAEPNWYQDLGAPSVWCASGALTLDQIKCLREKQNRMYGTAQVIEIKDDAPSTTGANEEMVMIDRTSSVVKK